MRHSRSTVKHAATPRPIDPGREYRVIAAQVTVLVLWCALFVAILRGCAQ
jgi:hypothetical protein